MEILEEDEAGRGNSGCDWLSEIVDKFGKKGGVGIVGGFSSVSWKVSGPGEIMSFWFRVGFSA